MIDDDNTLLLDIYLINYNIVHIYIYGYLPHNNTLNEAIVIVGNNEATKGKNEEGR